MKLKNIVGILLGIVLINSCSTSKNNTQVNNTWELTFEKNGCLDVCKAYTITITEKGNFNYKGNFKVKHLGVKTGVLKPKELVEVNRLREMINWPNIATNYGNNANGAQLKVLEYTTSTFKKKATYYNSEPQSIKDLEHYIDIIIDQDEL